MPRMGNLHREGDPLPGAEDEESRPVGATSQEAEARSRLGSYCLVQKMWNQDHHASWGNGQGEAIDWVITHRAE